MQLYLMCNSFPLPSCNAFLSSVLWMFLLVREVALRNSPSKFVSQLKHSSSDCHIIMAVAENESPEFHKQSEEYYKVSAADQLPRFKCQTYHDLDG